MDSNLQSSPQKNADAKTAFRKPSNDVTNRKYRRRSPVSGSSSFDGSPNRERNISPIPSREDPAKVSDDKRREGDGRELERASGSSKYCRSGDSYRHSDRHSSRSSHNYHRPDDYIRRNKYADGDERDNTKLSSHSGRALRDGSHSDHTRRENDYNRSRDYLRDGDKFSLDKSDGSWHRSRDRERETSSVEYRKYKDKDSSSARAGSGRKHASFNSEDVKSGERDVHKGDRDSRDEKRDSRRSLGEYKSDHSSTYEESSRHRNDSTSRRDSSGHRLKEVSRSDAKEMDTQRYTKEEKKKYDDWENNRHKERHNREPGEQFEDKSVFSSKDQDSLAKKRKLSSFDGGTNHGNDASEKQSSSSKQAPEIFDKVALEQAYVTDSDIDAAKVAAMKAAELVNKNLIGTGYMSTDQKKKLLWGNKKNTAAEETAHRWDTTMFGDRERQEKFHKLMSLRLRWYLWAIVGCEGRPESRPRIPQSRSSREAKGAAAGFREAIHGWASQKRRTHSWIRSLRIYLGCSLFRYSGGDLEIHPLLVGGTNLLSLGYL